MSKFHPILDYVFSFSPIQEYKDNEYGLFSKFIGSHQKKLKSYISKLIDCEFTNSKKLHRGFESITLCLNI